MNSSKKVVLVTGSSNGIGKETIVAFAKKGYDVVINYYSDKKSAYQLQKNIHKFGGKSLVIKADVSNEQDVKEMLDTIIKEFGKIDILVNNAGIAIDNDIYNKSKEEFLKILEVNLVGIFLVTKEATKYMNKGTIINISSTDGIDTYNDISMDYCASKAGVNSLTHTLALRFPNLNIYAVAPNWVKTKPVLEMDPTFLQSEMKRIGQKILIEPSEVAKKIIEISESSSLPSGSIIRINGGNND